MDLRETGYEALDWLKEARDRDQWLAFVDTVMNL
jgi:hypothetical protein